MHNLGLVFFLIWAALAVVGIGSVLLVLKNDKKKSLVYTAKQEKIDRIRRMAQRDAKLMLSPKHLRSKKIH